jgi:hypothetical protein
MGRETAVQSASPYPPQYTPPPPHTHTHIQSLLHKLEASFYEGQGKMHQFTTHIISTGYLPSSGDLQFSERYWRYSSLMKYNAVSTDNQWRRFESACHLSCRHSKHSRPRNYIYISHLTCTFSLQDSNFFHAAYFSWGCLKYGVNKLLRNVGELINWQSVMSLTNRIFSALLCVDYKHIYIYIYIVFQKTFRIKVRLPKVR